MDVMQELLTAMQNAGLQWTEPVELKRGELLFSAGRADVPVYLLEQGTVRIVSQNDEETNTIRFAYKGSLFAAMDNLITGQPTLYTAEAIKQVSIRSIPRAAFLDFINSDRKHLELWNIILGYIIIGQLERETDLLTTSPRERYERVLRRSPQLFQEVPHKYIASYLRMTPETLSRLQKS
ncbi:Crp/Fnr family transcriptional regulator [Flavobacterium album]|uniref:Crp/Fnr family transcriptional regulator n=1 Tax=Flavobacterium album TaxID=2175091 RepID=A0A2S1R261_9FLAO|nr:Crp/Fnr family transcriptional regulator [Flavobacterium album]AWH86707.1 Crp/Fnr family transcriptional regulator [Flavobacterium album]